MKIGIILLEGKHDDAFVYRLLKTVEYSNKTDSDIAKFGVIGNYFQTTIVNFYKGKERKQTPTPTELKEMPKFTIADRPSKLPKRILQKENSTDLLLLFTLGGDSQNEVGKNIIEAFGALNGRNGIEISLGIILDADNKGVKSRIDFIQETYSETIKPCKFAKFETYIFHENDKGKLEDIVLPLMEENNEDLFAKTKIFLENYTNPIFPTNSKAKEQRQDFDKQKSLIGAIGQLHKSGRSNEVHITDTPLITKEKIERNIKCQEIIKFIEGLMV